MKIICIGKNYLKHIEELNSKKENEPVIFLKPDTSIIQKKQPFFIPEFSNEIHYEIEIIIKFSRLGKHIETKFSNKYYEKISLGIDFTARDVQKQLKKNQEPWEKAKAFDGSAAVGDFVNKSEFKDIQNINFKLLVNNQIKQSGNTKNMIFSINKIVSYISKYITLKKGDLIFTGTPGGVDKIHKNDILQGFIGEKKILEIKIK